MSDHLQAELEKLWSSAQTPPDVVPFFKSISDSSPVLVAKLVTFDQQYRWHTAAPMTVEDYLEAVPEWRSNSQLILELAAGEYLARSQAQHLPHVTEYIERFPYLESDVRQKLSGLSTNQDVGNTVISLSQSGSLSDLYEIDEICDAFEDVWRSSDRPPFIEAWIYHGQIGQRMKLLKELLRVELCIRLERQETPTLQEYQQRFPAKSPFTDVLRDWENNPRNYLLTSSADSNSADSNELSPTTIPANPIHSMSSSWEPTAQRYRKIREIGKGAFGTVWLAEDLELRRQIALKEPRADRLRTASDLEAYVAEARVLASLDHPHIVPVYDVGRTAEGSCYVVSKLIEGMNLAAYVKQKPLSFGQTAELVAHLADALQQTHSRGLVHRDLKPDNILIDGHGQPYLTDFGLALREEDLGRDHGIAGTPAYMSPEQARGDGHLVDGRSDIFSLGVVLYELLTGTKPFNGVNCETILVQIKTVEARPLRQRNEAIPKELERICLKALSKRPADRYSCAADMAEDLRHWFSAAVAAVRQTASGPQPPAGSKASPAIPDQLSSGAEQLQQKNPADRVISAQPVTAILNDQPSNQPAFTGNNQRVSHWSFMASVIAFVILLGVGIWGRIQPKPPNNEAASNTGLSTKSPENSTPIPTDLRIIDFEIEHWALRDDGNVNPPQVFGKTSFAARQRDRVRLKLELSRPAYTYLLAFRPDGVVELCYPEDEKIAPPLSRQARYPSEAASRDLAYGLNEAPGLWVFTSIVSEKPLPPFAEWKTEHQLLSPTGAKGMPGVVLIDDGHSIEQWTASGPTRATRGVGDELPGHGDIAQIGDAVKKAAPKAIFRSIGFVAEPFQ